MAGLTKIDEKLFPSGVLVDNILDDKTYVGERLPNIAVDASESRASIPENAILDCTYVELWELREQRW